MTDPAEPKGFSPYAPPTILQESLLLSATGPPPTLAPVVTFCYAFGGTVAIALLLTVLDPFGSGLAIWLIAPLLALGGFVVLCITVFANRSNVRRRSTLWIILMTLAVPPAAMLVFVPTCAGTAMAIWPMMNGALGLRGEFAIVFIPVFFAMWVSCYVISKRLGSRFAGPPSPAAVGPYHGIMPSPPSPSPPAWREGTRSE